MTELCGAVALVQFKKLPAILSNMRASKKHIKDILEGAAGEEKELLLSPLLCRTTL